MSEKTQHEQIVEAFNAYLVEHGFNMNDKLRPGITKVTNWKEIYEHITGEKI